jgi:polyisoprenoid-binding protein YceI
MSVKDESKRVILAVGRRQDWEARILVMQTEADRGVATVRYLVDPAGSRFTVQAFATGLLSAFGHNPTIAIGDYDGVIQFASETFEHASVRVTLRTTAMEVLDEMKKDDLKKLEQEMYEKVLEVGRFPAAVYESQGITVQKLSNDLFHVNVTGELSFHGVRRPHSFDARVANMGSMLRVSGGFALRQSDYGIKPFTFAGGVLRLKDEVKFNFELVARKQDQVDASG